MTPELRLLGGAALFGADGRLLAGAAAQPRRLAVLAVLADAWPAAVTRDRIVGLLWPENDDAGARRLLTQALYAMRRELGDIVRASGRDLALDADALQVDLVAFRQAVRADDAERASALYRGPFLDGLHLRDAVEFERWADAVRDDSRRQLQRALEAMVASRAAEGRSRDAARWGDRLVETAPFDTAAVLEAMALWERAGDRGAALAAAAAYERRMRDELELEPDVAVRRRAAELRMLDPAAGALEAAPPVVAAAPSPPPPPPPPPPPAPGSAIAPRAAEGLPAPARPRHLRGRWRGVAVVGGLALSAALAWLVARPEAPAAPLPPPVVRLEPFELRGDAPISASVGASVRAILLANLDGAGGMRLARGPAAPGDSPPWGILRGTVVVSGDLLRLDAAVHPPGSGRPTTASVSGPRDSLIALAEQLSLQLVPAFYPQLDGMPAGVATNRVRRVGTLRRFLDGESSLRRGHFDSAWAAFRSTTEQDSTLAFAWYRRSMTAELAHRPDDADAAIAAAARHAGTLPPRDRRLIDGFRLWRLGDAAAADSVFRELVGAESRNGEAWFQLAELAYHAGPLLGRPIDAARDPWRQFVALDSGNYPALMHAVRLEARAGDTASVERLLRRAAAVHATGPAALESRVIAAYGVGDPASVADLLDALPAWSLGFVHAVVAGLLEQPEAAQAVARRMTRTSQLDAVRAEGHVALATLAMSRGRRRAAWAELDRAAAFNPVSAAWMRAYFAALPFLDMPDSLRRDAARQLTAAAAAPASAPLYQQLAVQVAAADVVEPYLALQLRIASGDHAGPPSIPCSAQLRSATQVLCADLSRGLAAESARLRGDAAATSRALAEMEMRVPYQLAARSLYFARTRERYLSAVQMSLEGRDDAAYSALSAVTVVSRFDYLFLAPTHLRRGRLRERAGDRAGAARHYGRAAALWRDADSEFAALGDSAAAGLARVSSSNR